MDRPVKRTTLSGQHYAFVTVHERSSLKIEELHEMLKESFPEITVSYIEFGTCIYFQSHGGHINDVIRSMY